MSKSLGIGGATLSDFLRFDSREDLWQIGSCPKFQKVGLLITSGVHVRLIAPVC